MVILNFINQNKKVEVKNRVGIWRNENGMVVVDGKDICKNQTVSGLKNGNPPYNFWMDGNVLKLNVIDSTNKVITPYGELRDGTINIKENCTVQIGNFKFTVQFDVHKINH